MLYLGFARVHLLRGLYYISVFQVMMREKNLVYLTYRN